MRFLVEYFLFDVTGTTGLFPEWEDLSPDNSPPSHRYYVLKSRDVQEGEVCWDYCLDNYHWETAAVFLKVYRYNDERRELKKQDIRNALRDVLRLV